MMNEIFQMEFAFVLDQSSKIYTKKGKAIQPNKKEWEYKKYFGKSTAICFCNRVKTLKLD